MIGAVSDALLSSLPDKRGKHNRRTILTVSWEVG
jgi:hypothetical protein